MGEEVAVAPVQVYNCPFRLPPQLELSTGNVSENYKKWKRQVEVYMAASGAADKTNEVQVAIILSCGGSHVVEICDQFRWENLDDKNDPAKVFEKLQAYCNPRSNEVLESHRFWKLPYQEPFDKFLTELTTRASSCNFKEQERMMRDKIVFTVTGKLQELLLREDKLTLERAIQICRAYEQSNIHVKELRENITSSVKVHKVRHDKKSENRREQKQGKSLQKDSRERTECDFCGYKHERGKQKCPAWGKQCEKCKGRNHFKAKCKKIHAVNLEEDEDHEDHWLHAVNSSGKEITALMCVNDCKVRFQLDSAADVNTICQKHVRKEQCAPTKVRLNMWNKTNMKPIRETKLEVTNPRTGEKHQLRFIVVQNGLTCLLGSESIQEMKLVTINDERFISNVKTEETLGDLGTATLKVDNSIPPKILQCRKIPLALQNDVKEELERLQRKGVLVPITEPTQWVSQMAIARKANGKLRLCIDPQALNTALMREHYRLPVLDDVLPQLNNAKIFTKLDVKEAFWHVKLDEFSSKLTTMITPFGRYRWARLPFGLKVSSEIFQRKLDEVFCDMDGVFSVVDDTIIAGCGKTDEEAKQDHDRKLSSVVERCEERLITLNKEKQEIGLREISFHGHIITRDGVKVDKSKVKAIVDMKAPTDVSGVKRLCGMVQYMAKFLPDLAKLLNPLRELTRKDSTEREVTIQVDASKNGIGAVLMQNERPIEYASRSLTTSERNWVQIEKEALAVLYGLERFDQYTYGRKVQVQNDHKPLAAILKKPLAMAPKRLQDIMMRFHRYDFDFIYVKGINLTIADTLSRAYLESEEGNFNERVRILCIEEISDIPDGRLLQIRETTGKDAEMQMLKDIVLSGWPTKKQSVPIEIRKYYDFKETISYTDGLLLKGEAVIIPKALRSDMKTRLHKAHLGHDSMMRRARGTIFWPGMNGDIKQLADCCPVCQETKPRNMKEPLMQHNEGSVPWEKIGLDLFETSGKNYLISVDYFSNFIEIDLMTTTTSQRVISLLKKQFARFGIPKVVISDGGPQFTSQEFKEFMKHWDITHKTSSPMHQQANGKAESAVKVMKTLVRKCGEGGTDPYEALLEQRNTPKQDTNVSPAQIMFGRKLRGFIPSIQQQPGSSLKEVIRKRKLRKQTVKNSHDRKARTQSLLDIEQAVYFQHVDGQPWRPGVIQDILGPRTYIVKGKDGATYTRNRIHLRPTNVRVQIRDQSPYRIDMNELPNHVGNPDNLMTKRVDTLLPENDYTVPEPIVNSNAPTPCVQTRPVRNRKPPNYLKDYVRS